MSERNEETLSGLTQLKIGDIFVYYMFGPTYVILYFEPHVFCVNSVFDTVLVLDDP